MNIRLSAGQHFGDIAKSYEVAGFTLTQTAYAPRVQLPRHAHERAAFCLILRGGYEERFGSLALDCAPSRLLFRPPGEPHSDHFHDTGSVCFLLEMDAAWLRNVREQVASFAAPMLVERSAANWLALRVYEEFQRRDEVSPLAVQGLTLALAAELARAPLNVTANDAPRWLQQVKEILHAQFAERLLLEDIAATVGVHPVYLAAAFRKAYDATIGEYVRKLRVEFACRELRKSDASLVDIALAAGFASQSHFSRTFKQITGMSPTQYQSLSR